MSNKYPIIQHNSNNYQNQIIIKQLKTNKYQIIKNNGTIQEITNN
jgi:hypothetical protein